MDLKKLRNRAVQANGFIHRDKSEVARMVGLQGIDFGSQMRSGSTSTEVRNFMSNLRDARHSSAWKV